MGRVRAAMVGVALMGVTLSACDGAILGDPFPALPCVCTDEFRVFMLHVVDQSGSPVADVALTRRNLRTGDTFEPGWLGLLEPGVYVVADDGIQFSANGDRVHVTGVHGTRSFIAEFRFAIPGPCRCHVAKLAGPDTVVMR